MAFKKLPLVSSYSPGTPILCMPDITSVHSGFDRREVAGDAVVGGGALVESGIEGLQKLKSGICASARFPRTITAAEVKTGLLALEMAKCKVCGTYNGLMVTWVENRRGCKGVCVHLHGAVLVD